MTKKKSSSKTDRTLERKGGKRQPFKRILIFCEGSKTEPNYFNAIRKHYRLTAVEVEPGRGGTSNDVLAKLENFKDLATEYDQVWVVFDTENLNQPDMKEDFAKALNQAKSYTKEYKKKNCDVKTAISNPCFEYWFILHHTYTNKALADCDETCQELKKYIPNYEKSMDIFSIIHSNTDKAINHATKCQKDAATSNPNEEYPNPCTTVHELVKELKNI